MDQGSENLESLVPHVLRFAVYMLRDQHAAEDVAQETMLRAIKHRKKLQRADNPRAWVLRITANLCRDHLRRGKTKLRLAGPLPEDSADKTPEPWFGMLQTEQCAELETAIRSLSDRESSVLYLSAFEDMACNEIGNVLNLNPATVRVALSRARQSVREVLARKTDQEQPL